MSDYLTPREQSSAIQIMYLRQTDPDLYRAMLAKTKGLGGIEEAFVISRALQGDGLGRFKLKKAFKKIAKVLKKANPIYIAAKVALPKSVQKKLVAFEHKHRKEIKKIGAGVALLAGGAIFAPSILAAGQGALQAGGAALSKVATVAKLAVTKAAAELGVKVPTTGAELMQEVKAHIPTGAELADKASTEIVDAVERVGRDKLQAIVNKYTDNGARPFTGPDDPRMAAATMEAMQNDPARQDTQNPENTAVNAAVTGSIMQDAQTLRQPGFNPLLLAIPAATFLFS